MQEQSDIREGLFKKGIGSRIALLETQREVARLRGDLGETKYSLRQAESAVLQAQNAIREHDSRWQNERARELETVMAELSEVQESLALFEDRVTRLAVRAPVRQAARINQLRNNASYISMGGRQRFDRSLDTADFPTMILGHVGDGNFHAVLLIDIDNEKEVADAERLNDEIVRLALSMDGTCTGEHGVGLHKIGFLVEEVGDDAIDLMRRIKLALDPDNIMNPGKVFRV